jgi:hypothetical protein
MYVHQTHLTKNKSFHFSIHFIQIKLSGLNHQALSIYFMFSLGILILSSCTTIPTYSGHQFTVFITLKVLYQFTNQFSTIFSYNDFLSNILNQFVNNISHQYLPF